MLLSEAAWWQVAESRVRAFFIVADHPFPSLFPHFAQGTEEMRLKHFVAKAPVETVSRTISESDITNAKPRERGGFRWASVRGVFESLFSRCCGPAVCDRKAVIVNRVEMARFRRNRCLASIIDDPVINRAEVTGTCRDT